MNLLWFALPAAALVSAARAMRPVALGENEEMDYSVSWAIIPGAGAITISGHPADSAGVPVVRVIAETSTRGVARLFLPFEARAESLFSTIDGRLLWFGESSRTRGKYDAHTVTFDYARGQAHYADQRTRDFAIPPGSFPTDLITCLIQSRQWNLKPGEVRDAEVLFEDKLYLLTVHAVGTETLMTRFGTVDTLILEPRMEKAPPMGIFKHGSPVRVWVTTDSRRLPVRFTVQLPLGTGVASLVKYRPPSRGLAENRK